MSDKKKSSIKQASPVTDYDAMFLGVVDLLEQARRTSARAVNAIMTATYWETGRRIVEHEQKGAARAEYGSALLKRLSADLTAKFGRGFSERNLKQMRLFYTGWQLFQKESEKSADPEESNFMSIRQTPSAEFGLQEIAACFLLPWSHYVRLLSVDNQEARRFYEAEALRGGWSVRQLDRMRDICLADEGLLARG